MAEIDRTPSHGQGLDWAEAHRRLRELAENLDMNDATSDRAQSVLRARATSLARNELSEAARSTTDQLAFRRGDETYVLPVTQVAEVVRVRIVSVPGIGSLYLGVASHEGGIICVVDLPRLLRRPIAAGETPNHVVVLSIDGVVLGIGADEVFGTYNMPDDDVSAVGASSTEELHKSIIGMTPKGWIALDASYVAGDARLIVDKELP